MAFVARDDGSIAWQRRRSRDQCCYRYPRMVFAKNIGVSYRHLPRDVSPIDGRMLPSNAIDINPVPILSADEGVYSEVFSLDILPGTRKDDEA